MEAQIAFEELLRLGNWSLEPEPLVWRTNLALRGLNALRIAFSRRGVFDIGSRARWRSGGWTARPFQ